MGKYYVAGIPFDGENCLKHYGVKNMEWGKHKFGIDADPRYIKWLKYVGKKVGEAIPGPVKDVVKNVGSFATKAAQAVGPAVNKGANFVTGNQDRANAAAKRSEANTYNKQAANPVRSMGYAGDTKTARPSQWFDKDAGLTGRDYSQQIADQQRVYASKAAKANQEANEYERRANNAVIPSVQRAAGNVRDWAGQQAQKVGEAMPGPVKNVGDFISNRDEYQRLNDLSKHYDSKTGKWDSEENRKAFYDAQNAYNSHPLTAIPEMARQIGSDVANRVSDAAGNVKDWAGQAAGNVGGAVSGAANKAAEGAKGFLNSAGKWVSGTANNAKDAVSKAASDATKGASGFLNSAGQWVSNAAGNVKDAAQNAGNAIGEAANNARGGIGGFFDRVGDTVRGAADSVGDWGREAAGNIGGAISDAAGNVRDWAGQAAGNVGQAAEQARGGIGGFFDRVGDWSREAAGNVGGWIGDRANDVGGAISGAANNVRDWAGQAAQNVGNAVQNAGQAVGDFVNYDITGNGYRQQAQDWRDYLNGNPPRKGMNTSTLSAEENVRKREEDANNSLFGRISDAAGNVKDWAGQAAGNIGGAVSGAAGNAVDWARNAAGNVGNAVSGAAENVADWARNAAGNVGDFVDYNVTGDYYNQQAKAWQDALNSSPANADMILAPNGMMTPRYNAERQLQNYSQDANNTLFGRIGQAAQNVGNAVSGAADWARNTARNVGGAISGAADNVRDWAGQQAQNVGGAISGAAGNVRDFLSDVANPRVQLNTEQMVDNYRQYLNDHPENPQSPKHLEWLKDQVKDQVRNDPELRAFYEQYMKHSAINEKPDGVSDAFWAKFTADGGTREDYERDWR